MDENIRRALTRLERDDSGRSEAEVFRADGAYLKIGPAGSLCRAARMQAYFEKKGLAAELIAYDSDGARDYLLVRAMEGEQGTRLLDRPKWLAECLGEGIRRLHEVSMEDCPLRDVNERAVEDYARQAGTPFPEDVSPLVKDALVHGDCCLPNAFFGENGRLGWIDLGDSGVGDRHFDLFWARWSLEYNLKTDAYADRLLDAYGRDAIDRGRLELCARLSRLPD